MRLAHEPLPLETRFEFRIAHARARLDRENVLVRLEHQGVEGLGEAAPSHYYGENQTLVDAAIDTWGPVLGDDPFDLDAIFAPPLRPAPRLRGAGRRSRRCAYSLTASRTKIGRASCRERV